MSSVRISPVASAVVILCTLPFAQLAHADTFGSGDNTFEIEFVTIGDPGNLADTTGIPNPAGSVDYVYRIGKYEISREMVDKATADGGLAARSPSGWPGAHAWISNSVPHTGAKPVHLEHAERRGPWLSPEVHGRSGDLRYHLKPPATHHRQSLLRPVNSP